MSGSETNLIWIDLEMTGLNPEVDRIIEIATLVTDANLNILAEGPVIAVHQSDEQLALMDEWNVRTHTGSGLVERVKASTFDEATAAQKPLSSCSSGFLRVSLPFVVTVLAKIVVFYSAICLS